MKQVKQGVYLFNTLRMFYATLSSCDMFLLQFYDPNIFLMTKKDGNKSELWQFLQICSILNSE